MDSRRTAALAIVLGLFVADLAYLAGQVFGDALRPFVPAPIARLVMPGVEAPRRGIDKKWAAGQDVTVSLTLVSTDARALACASTEAVEGARCEFDTPGVRGPHQEGDAPRRTLAPYKTTDDVLLLVPALFSEPELARHLEADPPDSGREHARFLANCRLHLTGRVTKLSTRWEPRGEFFPQPGAWVGTVSGCKISIP